MIVFVRLITLLVQRSVASIVLYGFLFVVVRSDLFSPKGNKGLLKISSRFASLFFNLYIFIYCS